MTKSARLNPQDQRIHCFSIDSMTKRCGMLTVLFLVASICGGAQSDSRERELAYLRKILPDSLLECAPLEVVMPVDIIGKPELERIANRPTTWLGVLSNLTHSARTSSSSSAG